MGWTGGTDIFDAVAKIILNPAFVFVDAHVIEAVRLDILKALVKELGDQDWDTESESAYWNHPLVQRAFRETFPGLYDDAAPRG